MSAASDEPTTSAVDEQCSTQAEEQPVTESNDESSKPEEIEPPPPEEQPEETQPQEESPNPPPEKKGETEETTEPATQETIPNSESNDEKQTEAPEENSGVDESSVADAPEESVEAETPVENCDAGESSVGEITEAVNDLSIGDESNESSFNTLSPEIATYIFSMLSVNDLLNVQMVCKKWKEYGRSDAIWNMLYEETAWSIPFTPEYEVETWYEIYQMRSRYEVEQLAVDYYMEEDQSSDPFEGLLSHEEISAENLVKLLGMEEFVSALQNGEENVLS